MPKRLQRLSVPALLVVLIAAFYWPLSLTAQYDWMWAPDLAQQVLPWYEEEARQFQHATFPTWDAHEWGGQPLLAQGQPGAAYPLNWILFLLPRVDGHISVLALAWYFIVIHMMAALFAYLLCRDLQRSRFAALIGGLIFAFGSYVGTVWWPQMLNGAIWAPAIFMFLLRTTRDDRPIRKRIAAAALCGLVWGMAWLSGHHQAPMFISIAAAFTWIVYIVRGRSLKLAALAATATIFMFFTAALQLLPSREYGHLAKRWVSAPEPVTWNQPVPYTVHTMFSLSPLNAFGIVIPGLGGATDPFVGFIAVTLAGIAIATLWSKPEVKLFTALAAGAFLYALGSHDVFQGMLYAVVPLLNMARTPPMALVVFSLGVATLAAHGVDQLIALRESDVLRRIGWTVLGAALLLWALLLALVLAKNGADDRASMAALIAGAAGVLLFAWHKRSLAPRTATTLLTGLLMIELGAVIPVFANKDDPAKMADLNHIRGDKDLVDFLNRQQRPFRVEMETEELPVSWPAYNDFDEIKASGASITVNRTQTEFWTPQNRDLTGVRFTIGRTSAMPGARQVFEGASGMKIFENPHVFPRAWAVYELINVPTVQQGQALIRDHLDDLHTKAFTVARAAPPFQNACSEPGAVNITRYEPTRVSIRATLPCDGMVVLSDTFYPGWNATVDNHPALVMEVNLAMRGVRIAKGEHRIEYRYQPATVYLGGAMTGMGIIAATLVALLLA